MALIALGVTGGIGAYKAVEVCRGLQKRGHDVQAVMTRSARAVRGAADVRGDHPASGDHVAVAAGHERRHRAHRDCRSRRPAAGGAVHGQRHRQVRQRHRRRLPDLALPGDAGAGAAGAGDELEHAGARRRAGRTCETLQRRGVRFVEPGEGYLACGWMGKGRLAEPDDIVEAAVRVLAGRSAPRRRPASARHPIRRCAAARC